MPPFSSEPLARSLASPAMAHGPLVVALLSALMHAVPADAQDVATPPSEGASGAPLRLSRRCTCPDPTDFRTTPIYAPAGINNAENLAGSTSPRVGRAVHAAVSAPSGVVDDLFGDDLRSARAADINDAGVVVGEVAMIRANGDVVHSLFRAIPGRGIEELPSPVPGPSPRAVALSESGDVLVAQAGRGFVWSAATRAYVELPTLGRGITVSDLNDAGDVVGAAIDAAGERRAALWSGRPYALTVLQASVSEEAARWTPTEASAINGRGTIVGSACDGSACVAAAWLGPTHAFRVLGSGGTPTDVNEHDLATGSPASLTAHSLLLLWDVASGEEIRLRMPTPYLHVALALNDAGSAVGFRYGFEPDHLPAVRFPRVVCED